MSERRPRQEPDPARPGPAGPDPSAPSTPSAPSAPGTAAGRDAEHEEGGDPACWIHLVCPECGAIESGGHRPGCGSARPMLMIRAAPGSGQELIVALWQRPSRVIIPACIGCRAMRQEEGCAGGCSERKLELVSGDDYDELMAAAADCRARVQGLRAVAGELARTEPGPGEWQAAYETLQRSARAALRHYRPAPRPAARAIRFRPPGP